MNAWLAGATDHTGLDLDQLLVKIKGHEKVCFSHEGRKFTKTNKEITEMVHTALCKNCNALRAELYLLRTDKNIKPDAHELIRQYIDDNYVTARSRNYSRRQLYHEVAMFLKPFGIPLTKEMESYIIHDLLRDESPQYRRLKLQRSTDVPCTSTNGFG